MLKSHLECPDLWVQGIDAFALTKFDHLKYLDSIWSEYYLSHVSCSSKIDEKMIIFGAHEQLF